MRREILGFWAEKIFAEVSGNSIEDNEELIEAIEKNILEDKTWKGVWLSEGKEDYAELFVSNEGDAIFLLWTIEDELYIVDLSEIPKNPALSEWFTAMITNFFVQKLFPRKILDVEWVKE
ncbi:MAG: hypothetical protein QXT92_00035 [Nitrososphaerota archaeon]